MQSKTGTIIKWDEKDDIQRIVTYAEVEAAQALNTVLEYKYVFDFFISDEKYINQAPFFWGEVLVSLRYTMLMRAARIFDESKDALGMKKILNMIEQSIHGQQSSEIIKDIWKQYNNNASQINQIRLLRDKLYAHNDKTEYQDWKHDRDIEFDSEVWFHLEELLRWAKESYLKLRTSWGESYPLYFEIKNDVYKIKDYQDR